MIGDRSHDMVGAKNNGMKRIGVLYGYGSREELIGAGARTSARRRGQFSDCIPLVWRNRATIQIRNRVNLS